MLEKPSKPQRRCRTTSLRDLLWPPLLSTSGNTSASCKGRSPGLQLHVDFGTVSTFLRPLLIRATVSLAMCCIWRLGETDPTRSIRSGPFPPINNGKAGPALTWGQTDLCRGMGRTVLHPGCSRLAGDASVCHSPKEKTSQQRISHSLAALLM